MARRKRKDDTPAWVAPDFDEVGFMRREIEGARAAVATIAWAIVGALVGFALYSVLPVLAFLRWNRRGIRDVLYFPAPRLQDGVLQATRLDRPRHHVLLQLARVLDHPPEPAVQRSHTPDDPGNHRVAVP